jgi:hypothetical protein
VSADWRQRAASAARSKGTRIGDGSAPGRLQGWGAVLGERESAGVVGWLGERRPNGRTPDVRRKNVYQSGVGRDREEKSKGYALLGKAQGCIGEASGAVA